MFRVVGVVGAICLVGCASTIPISSQVPVRAPASLLPAQAKIAKSLTEGIYSGPILLEASNRLPARLFLPTNYTERERWPLVILLHGFTGWADFADNYLTLRYRTTSRGFILLAPEGTKTPAGLTAPDGRDLTGAQFWNANDFCCDFAKTGVDDVAYLTQLLHEVKAKYRVDPKMVYIIGHSNGGFMANRMGCEIGTEIAAIASLAGGSFKDIRHCRTPTPVGFLQIHAEDDKTVTYNSAPEYAGGLDTVAQWTERNSCLGSGKKGRNNDFLFLLPGPDTTERKWACANGKNVALWTIKAAQMTGHEPHIPIFNLNFTDKVLDFLFQHRMARHREEL